MQQSTIIQVQDLQEFQSQVLVQKKVTIMVIVAEWCPPSLRLVEMLKKELDQQRKRLNQGHGLAPIDIYVVDHDKEQCAAIVKMFCPSTLPYLYLFEKGKYIAQFGGMDVFAMQKVVIKALEASRAQ